MPADLDQFRRENSHRAIIGGKGLVKLGHMAADTRPFLNQIDFKSSRGQIERGLNTTDTAPHDHDITEIIVTENLGKLLDLFDRQYFVFHVLSPDNSVSESAG